MRPRRIRKLLSIALGLTVLWSLWYYLAPATLGGRTTYVVTSGISMEPRFHSGDLAIVRSQSSYHVGEIVAYHNKMLGRIVLHRIIGREDGRYIFKGDNNNFIDPEHPLANQLIGALWLHIPGAGARLQSIRSPALMGALLFFGMLLLTGGAFARTRGRRHRQRRAGEGTAPPPRQVPGRPAEPVTAILGVGLLALLPFLMLALLAFTRAPSARRPFKIPYKQSGALSYSADAAPGPAYPGDRAVTGDPLFTRVLNVVDLRYGYRFDSTAKHSLTGNASLSATIASTSGWQSTFPLGAPKHFRGDRALITGALDLSSLSSLIHSVELATRVRGAYTLTITPHVSATGSLGATPLYTVFSPEIKFLVSEGEIQAAVSGSGSPTAGKSSGSELASSSSGSATGSRYQPLFLSLVLGRMSVATARTISLSSIAVLVGALVAILALLRPVLALLRPRRRDELARILARYGGLIIRVAHVSQLPGVAVIDVADMDALARIAEHYDRSILYEVTEEGHAFWVADESGQFRFVLDAPAPAPELDAPEPELPAPARSSERQSPAPSWAEAPTTELAAVPAWTADTTADTEPAAAQWAQSGLPPAWSESAAEEPAVAQTWAESAAEEPTPAPAWEESYEVYAPLANEVYADELELGGEFRASGTQPAPPDSVAPESVAPEGPAPEDWQTKEDPDTIVLERTTERAPGERGGVSRTRAGAVYVHVTGF